MQNIQHQAAAPQRLACITTDWLNHLIGMQEKLAEYNVELDKLMVTGEAPKKTRKAPQVMAKVNETDLLPTKPSLNDMFGELRDMSDSLK